jgi:hypothetical protein
VDQSIFDIKRSGNGIIISAVHIKATHASSKYIVEAAKCARRIKDVLRPKSDVKVLLFTDKLVWRFMNAECDSSTDEVCGQFQGLGGHRLFDSVMFYDGLSMPLIPSFKPFFHESPVIWMKRIVGWLHSPFSKTMAIDADVYVCPGFDSLFDTYIDNKHLLAATIANTQFGNTNGSKLPLRPGIPAKEFAQFPERNMGFIIVNTGHPKGLELLALFRDAYARHLNDPNVYILGDQASMREALFTMRVWVRDKVIPGTIVCRFQLGCEDGCSVVHRHWDRDKSGANVRPQPRAFARISGESPNEHVKNPT